jgi:glycosyltransferase involved in cell wall biosynthesis
VVTDTGATTDLVDATNGMIIEKNNVPAIKAAILQYLGMDTNALKQQSEASLKKFHDRFSWKKVAEGHMRVFEEVLSESVSKNEGEVGGSGTDLLS